jgi:hypothetical protein
MIDSDGPLPGRVGGRCDAGKASAEEAVAAASPRESGCTPAEPTAPGTSFDDPLSRPAAFTALTTRYAVEPTPAG